MNMEEILKPFGSVEKPHTRWADVFGGSNKDSIGEEEQQETMISVGTFLFALLFALSCLA